MRRGAHAHDPISRIKSAKQIYTWINKAKIIVRYPPTPPPPPPHPHPHPLPNNRWQTVVCISYLLDKIYHYIKIILMISWVVIMLLFWHYQKLFQLRAKISYDILTDSPQIINDKVLFAIHICLITSFNILTLLMISFLCSSNAVNFYTTKTIPTWPRGQNIVWYFAPPPPPNNQWQSFICLSYLLKKIYYCVKIIFMISLVFMMLLFCTTNTWFHKVMDDFISCELKQDTYSHNLILFW